MDVTRGRRGITMETYLEKKRRLVETWKNNGLREDEIKSRLIGMEESEKCIEEVVRGLLSTYAGLTQTLGTILDTKKSRKRDDLLGYLESTPNLIPELKQNLQTLINIVRI